MNSEDVSSHDEVTAAVEAQVAQATTVEEARSAIKVAEAVKEAKPNDVVVLAVKGIVVVTILAILGVIGLISQGKQPPDGVIAVASAGVGALSTLLTVRARGDNL